MLVFVTALPMVHGKTAGRMYVGNIFLSFPVHALPLCFVHLLSSRNLSSLILSLSPIFILSFFFFAHSFLFLSFHFFTHTHPQHQTQYTFQVFSTRPHNHPPTHLSIHRHLRRRMLQEAIPQEQIQALRSVDKSVHPNSVPLATPDEIYHVETQVDPDTQKDIVLWDDILQAFKDAVQVRHKTKVVPFLKGKDFRM